MVAFGYDPMLNEVGWEWVYHPDPSPPPLCSSCGRVGDPLSECPECSVNARQNRGLRYLEGSS